MNKHASKGENIREMDIYRAGDVVANFLAYTLQPDLVVIAGDVWDTSNPGPLSVRHGFDFHQTIRSADIPCVVIGGNHDTLTAVGRPTPLDHLARYFDCNLALEQCEIEVAGVRLCCIPYRTLSTNQLRPVKYAGDVPNLLVAHAAADGKDLPDFAKYDHTRLSKSVLLDPQSCVRLLGHIHVHQAIDERAYYSGALERLTWGEIANQPAIYVHRVYPDGRVDTESILVRDMGSGDIPRPALDLTVDCSALRAEEAVEAAHACLEEPTLDDHLVQLTLDNVAGEIFAIHYEDSLIKRATARGAFALKVRVRAMVAESLHEKEEASAEPVPGAALADAYRVFAAEQGDNDLIDAGAHRIAVATGEVASE